MIAIFVTLIATYYIFFQIPIDSTCQVVYLIQVTKLEYVTDNIHFGHCDHCFCLNISVRMPRSCIALLASSKNTVLIVRLRAAATVGGVVTNE